MTAHPVRAATQARCFVMAGAGGENRRTGVWNQTLLNDRRMTPPVWPWASIVGAIVRQFEYGRFLAENHLPTCAPAHAPQSIEAPAKPKNPNRMPAEYPRSPAMWPPTMPR